MLHDIDKMRFFGGAIVMDEIGSEGRYGVWQKRKMLLSFSLMIYFYE